MNKHIEYRVLGLMSGTSLDGLDVASCRFIQRNDTWEFEIEVAHTFEYERTLQSELEQAIHLSGHDLRKLDIALGKLHGKWAKQFMDENDLSIDFISTHGHTIFHQPQLGITQQIGLPAEIVAATGLTVIADFRSTDVALGGQGAPLVPAGEKYLFSGYKSFLNLGGIANISFHEDEKMEAFDICPCNQPMNELCGLVGLAFDEGGQLARKGKVISMLLDQLNNLKFYSTLAPKSLGKEFNVEHFMPLVFNHIRHNNSSAVSEETIANALATISEHIAIQIAKELNKKTSERLMVTGGGALNTFLIERIKASCNHEIFVPDIKTVQFKEALIFGFLGVLRWIGKPTCFASVTGASRDSISGSIYHGTN